MDFNNPLLDEVFLHNLYSDRSKTIYAKIIALNNQEEPIEQIEGRVTGGSVSLDGSSNVRRSCNITMVAQEMDINSYYWGFKNKFKLYIGLQNNINNFYDDIIWFPFGVMIITNFSTSQSTNGYTISINGKDKMCLINGELGGSLFAAVDFGKEEVYDSETMVTTMYDIPIERIVREAIHEYAQEPWENIIINDLDDYGLELLDYKGSKPMYLLISEENTSNTFLGDVIQMTLNGNTTVTYSTTGVSTTIGQLKDGEYNPRSKLNFEGADIGSYKTFYYGTGTNRQLISVAKIEYGQTCGYRYTDITYAGDLILNTGEPITSMLDKLVAMLGNWEYFYNIDGRFVFQRKKTYLDKTWNNIITNNDNSYVPTSGETYVESALWSSAVSWNFTDSFFVTSFNNTPVLNNVKNDYSIWGTKQGIDGSEYPVHLRYAIDKKPSYYKCITGDSVNSIIEDSNGNIYTNKGVVSYEYKKQQPDNGKYVFKFHGNEYVPYSCLKLDFGTRSNGTIYLQDLDHNTSSEANLNSHYIASNGWVFYGTDYKFHWLDLRLTENDTKKIIAGLEAEWYSIDGAKERGLVNPELIGVDWRELIFQMAKDFRQFAHYTPYDENDGKEHKYTNVELQRIADNFPALIRLNNGKTKNGEWRYPSGKTGYEQYYTDIEGFWRQLYCPPKLLSNWQNTGVWTDRATNITQAKYINGGENADGGTVSIILDNATKTNILYFLSTNWVGGGNAMASGWNRQIIDSPANINFWFDFLDADKDSDFAKYSVPMIGDRAKSVNDSMVKAIYFREVPNTIFTPDISTLPRKSGYTYMQYTGNSNMEALFNISSQGKSAIDVMEEWINNYVYAVESANISTVPIYHLQPNTRIKIMDADSKINGDYIVSRISIPLAYNGTMSITATKVADRVY